MGSFNVACSISNLSINAGDQVMFFPLMPNRAPRHHRVGVQSMLIYANCYFNPLSLPIAGEYDDYGGLTNVVETANTRALEKMFGISIRQFINCLTVNRDWNDYFSGVHEAYAEKPKLLSSYEVRMSDKFLKGLGFVADGDGFKFGDFPYRVFLKKPVAKEEMGFTIQDADGTEVFTTRPEEWQGKRELLTQWLKLTGWYLGVRKQHQRAVKLISQLSGMFVLHEVYDGLSRLNSASSYEKDRSGNKTITGLLTEKVLQDLGFTRVKVAQSPEFKDRQAVYYSRGKTGVAFERYGSTILWKQGKKEQRLAVYSVEEFGEAWTKVTQEILNLDPYRQEYQADIRYDAYRAELQQQTKASTTPKTTDPEILKLYADLRRLNRRFGSDAMGGYFKDWKFFRKLYEQPILAGELKAEFRWYVAFLHSMMSNNRFFFPAANGEQCGNDEESKVLLETSLAVVNRRLAARAAQEAEDEE